MHHINLPTTTVIYRKGNFQIFLYSLRMRFWSLYTIVTIWKFVLLYCFFWWGIKFFNLQIITNAVFFHFSQDYDTFIIALLLFFCLSIKLFYFANYTPFKLFIPMLNIMNVYYFVFDTSIIHNVIFNDETFSFGRLTDITTTIWISYAISTDTQFDLYLCWIHD